LRPSHFEVRRSKFGIESISVVAQYFKFRSAQELLAVCQRLGLQIALSDDLSPLFQPVRVGSFRVGNSLCIQPMEGCDGTAEGDPGELTYRRFHRFGAGGAKLIWGEATAVVEEGRANTRQLLLNERNVAHFARLVQECRVAHRSTCRTDEDILIGLQLTHSGRYSYRRPLLACHDALLDPHTVADKASGRRVSEADPLLGDDYLDRLPDYYATAAGLAFQAGFQFVDIKQCHRYLLGEMLAARTRPGRYGESLENRTRLARNIFTAIRTEVPELLMASRVNVYDSVPFRKDRATGVGEPCLNERGRHSPCAARDSRTTMPATEDDSGALTCWGADSDNPLEPDLREPIWWINEMKRLGVMLINVSMGNPYASPHILRPAEYPPIDGYLPPEHPLVGVDRHFRLAGTVQTNFPDLPVVGSGYSFLQEFLFQAGAANLRDRRITFVGVGRAALAQPDFARQLQDGGKIDRKHICRTFSYCTGLMRSKHNELGQFATGCPPFDKEVYGPIWEEAKKK
jgi:2,4-dienoyl-CoA reductase-like NADH-dependent reductase (Old Yellow Enzyme family)